MKCWIGKEVEHNDNFGKLTLFVKSSSPDADIINSILKKYPDVETVYLGAGERDVKKFEGIEKIQRSIYLECNQSSFDNIPDAIYKLCTGIIIRCTFDRNLKNPNNVYMKYRSNNSVYIEKIKSSTINSLENLSDMMYENDKLVYDKGEML